MLRKVALFLTHNPLTTRFLKGPAPQWAVLFTDIVLVWAAAMLTFAFNPSAGPEPSTGIFSIWAKSLAVTAIYAIYMLQLRTFRSVIRLSTIYDTYQVAKTVILASLTILLLDAVIAWTGHGHYIGTWNIFVLAVFAFAIMVTVRLMIKYLYSLLSAGMDAKRVVVLGSSISSFTLSSALLSSADSGFKPVLMLSTNSSFTDKTVNGIPIKEYNPETVAEIFKDYNADTLLLQNSEIDFLRNTNDFAGKFYFAVNKTDTVSEADLSAYVDYCRMILSQLLGTEEIKIFPVSAKEGTGIEELKTAVLTDCRNNAEQILEESAEKKLKSEPRQVMTKKKSHRSWKSSRTTG